VCLWDDEETLQGKVMRVIFMIDISVVTYTGDGCVGQVVKRKDARSEVHGIHFTDSKMFYNDDKAVVVLDYEWRVVEVIEVGTSIQCIRVSDDEGTLFLVCDDLTGRAINLKTKKAVTFRGHTAPVRDIIPCERNDVLTCSRDGTIRRWNMSTGECIRVFTGHCYGVYSIRYDEKTKRIFSASGETTIKVWNAETGEKIGEMQVMKYSDEYVKCIDFVNSTTIASGNNINKISIWDTNSMKNTMIIDSNRFNAGCLVGTTDGQHIISGLDEVEVHSAISGEYITTLSLHVKEIKRVAVSPDGRFIASAGADRLVFVYKVTPPFPVSVKEGSLITSTQIESSCRILSDGRLLNAENTIISITASTICTVDNETQFTLQTNETSDNSSISFTAPSAISARQWVEVILAVRHNLTVNSNVRSYSAKNIIHRHRFDLLQNISFDRRKTTKQSLVNKDIMQIIGNYVMLR
jgi:WD40 repeat protein